MCGRLFRSAAEGLCVMAKSKKNEEKGGPHTGSQDEGQGAGTGRAKAWIHSQGRILDERTL